jgi:carboxyl-terminal processing protease
MSKAIKAVLLVSIAVIIGASAFLGGYVLAHSDNTVSFATPDLGGKKTIGDQVDEVEALLQDQALKPPTETTATAGAIQGLLDSTGDKYALYFDARHYGYFNEESMGAFGGIGVVLGEKDGTTYVVEVYKDTPAAEGGLKSGDLFVSIDGVERDKWTSEEVVKRVRGEEGTDVKLIMRRPGKKGAEDEDYPVTLTRAMIKLPNVESEMKDGVGYIRLGQFNAKSADDLTAAIEKLEKKGAKSFVLDLRDNPGGLLDQAVDVSSLFIKSGVIVQVEKRDSEPVKSLATGRQVTDAPLVLLVNGNSASASEIVAGALQDHNRAELVGEKTFGKGSVQTVEELSDGSAVKFTIAHYLTPKGRSIDGKGLKPDVVVKMDPEKQADEKTDVQLQKALEIAAAAAQ